MSDRELNDLKRKLYQLEAALLDTRKDVSKTESDLADAYENVNEVKRQIDELENNS